MGLFRPLQENTCGVAPHETQHSTGTPAKNFTPSNNFKKSIRNASGNVNNKMILRTDKPSLKAHETQHSSKLKESTISLLGISDEEVQELNEGNCNSSTCKCKGGTCPVDVTDGISTSAYAAKKLASAGSNNQTDMNAVKPNAEYNRQNDALFIGDGDSPETSKTNIPAILAAKTAGGSPHGWTTSNGINGKSADVFKIKKFGKRDDDDGPNG